MAEEWHPRPHGLGVVAGAEGDGELGPLEAAGGLEVREGRVHLENYLKW